MTFCFINPFSDLRVFLIGYFTGSRFRINVNNNLVILMKPQPQSYIFGSCRPQSLQNLFAGVPQNEDPLCPSSNK